MKAKLQTKTPALTPEKVNALVKAAAEKIVSDLAPKLATNAVRETASNLVERLVNDAVRPAVKACLQAELDSGDYTMDVDVPAEAILADCKPLADRITALEERLAELESAKPAKPKRFDPHHAE